MKISALKNLIKEKQREYNLGVVEVFSAQREELVRAVNPDLPASEFTNPSSEDLDTGLKGKGAQPGQLYWQGRSYQGDSAGIFQLESRAMLSAWLL